ncbi:hypothetical protein F503_03534 [Ophiostoma piceae UAMH 11346]|uniref:SWR1-complex protein 3 domain-containing protein n=1 Tax=Ophiostoma piceae (strain UAMH 11346) TaxID=1262450 RepID=S3BVA3_OPHP1|nr:hypothetical protein F503_03534 [Ophiostoma piceae UAMH 11346]
MERKRKLPARAAARVEQAAKRRTSTPPADSITTRSATPALSTIDTEDDAKSQPEGPLRPPLPRSIQPGKPLPTVEQAQPDDLSGLEYQSVQESGVLPESLSRSRQRWITEGIFEKYWTKPSKRKGAATDDAKNPPRDSMVKLGQILITCEPHMFEATMYGVKDPKPATVLPANRPVIMYGPSRGMMPPPSAPGTPTMPKQPKKKKQPTQSPAQSPAPSRPATPGQNAAMPVVTPIPPPLPMPQTTPTPQHVQLASPLPPQTPVAAAAPAAKATPLPPSTSKSILQPPNVSHQTPPPALSQLQSAPPRQQSLPPAGAALMPKPTPTANGASPSITASGPNGVAPSPSAVRPPVVQPSPIAANAQLQRPSPSMSPAPGLSGRQPSLPPGAARPPTATPPATDQIIVILAERASGDPELRDLMKRVANQEAPKDELDRFQAIIHQITAEQKRNAAVQAPSADRLIVDGRTVRYFAEEVRAILDIVLRSNPKQTSADLRPPVGSDPLVVLLVKAALDDVRVRDMVRRIGENQPQFSDATDLEDVLKRLKNQLTREQEALERQQLQAAANASVPLAPAGGMPTAAAQTNAGPAARGQQIAPGTPQAVNPAAAKVNGTANGTPSSRAQASVGTPTSKAAAQYSTKESSQALRSKGPAPAAKMHDVSALVFEIGGGNGDRYLFPKFSVIQYIPMPHGPPDLVASFLIVRKGSASEYGGDPDLDYYQPITVRFQVSPLSSSQKILDYFARVVAPKEEVSRYMDNIMNSMTRAEYVLLAMRLPRKVAQSSGNASSNAAGGSSDIAKIDDDTAVSSGDKMDIDKKSGEASNGTSNENTYTVGHPQPPQNVLWTATSTPSDASARPKTASSLLTGVSTMQQRAVKQIVDEDQQYQGFIAGLIPKEVEEEA